MAFKSLVGLANLPQQGDTIKVYETGTTVLVEGLTDSTSAESTLTNPFTIPPTISWGFEPPSSVRVDIWWEEGNMYLITDANVRDSAKDFQSPVAFALALGG
ncbi:hypothetical protein GW916_14135 [bacterium]|nr:hypothetical protein [bacterium]